jgi:hypothetical protein
VNITIQLRAGNDFAKVYGRKVRNLDGSYTQVNKQGDCRLVTLPCCTHGITLADELLAKYGDTVVGGKFPIDVRYDDEDLPRFVTRQYIDRGTLHPVNAAIARATSRAYRYTQVIREAERALRNEFHEIDRQPAKQGAAQ